MTGARPLIGLRDLILFNIAAVISMRWIAAAAHAGPVSIWLWVLAAALFFVPSAIAVGALSRQYPLQGGLYVWARESFGEWHGFVCGYCYIVSNLFYFASLSVAIASAGTLLLGLSLPDGAILWGALAFIWLATAVAMAGGRAMKWIGNAAGLGTCVAAAALPVIWFAHTPGTTAPAPVPPGFDWGTLNLWSQMAFAFAGLELGAVMAGEIREPGRTVPLAAAVSGCFIAGAYIIGTASVLSLMRPEDVSPVTGLIEAMRIGGGPAGSALGAAVVLGMAGQLGAWINGNARLPFVIGMDRFLPAAFARLHPARQTPWVSLLSQAAAASVLAILVMSGETARAGYQLLVDMTVLLAFLPFVYIFLAARKAGHRFSGTAGAAVTVTAMLLSLVPPAGVASVLVFELKVAGGCAVLVVLARLYFLRVAPLRGRE